MLTCYRWIAASVQKLPQNSQTRGEFTNTDDFSAAYRGTRSAPSRVFEVAKQGGTSIPARAPQRRRHFPPGGCPGVGMAPPRGRHVRGGPGRWRGGAGRPRAPGCEEAAASCTVGFWLRRGNVESETAVRNAVTVVACLVGHLLWAGGTAGCLGKSREHALCCEGWQCLCDESEQRVARAECQLETLLKRWRREKLLAKGGRLIIHLQICFRALPYLGSWRKPHRWL